MTGGMSANTGGSRWEEWMLDTKRMIYCAGLSFGCDPELFIESKGKVIGAERVIGKEGIDTEYSQRAFVLDGVQIELNPRPHFCRQELGREIAVAFRALKAKLASMGDMELTASFRAVVEVDADELESLSDAAKLLGCGPSLNKYDPKATISVDPTYRTRSAGGHIHLGLHTNTPLFQQRERLIPLLDVLLGNTSVMIDREPLAAKRREVYGRAGEYRLPEHGIEYRTLSNFWLRSYPLMSFVMGMTRLAASVLHTTTLEHTARWDAESDLLKRVDLEKVARAINTNDLALAKENWQGVREFIASCPIYGGASLDSTLLDRFDVFLQGVESGGLEKWFPADPMEHWTKVSLYSTGWELFLHGIRPAAAAAAGSR